MANEAAIVLPLYSIILIGSEKLSDFGGNLASISNSTPTLRNIPFLDRRYSIVLNTSIY
jgi:hypothetical protein